MRRLFPLAICFIAGVAMLTQYFVPFLEPLYENALIWGRIIAAFTLMLGMLSLVKVHTARVKRRTANWQYSIITLGALAYMMLAGFLSRGGAFEALQKAWGSTPVLGSLFSGLQKVFDFDSVFMNVQIPIQATMFSLLAFYIASAAFRAFRARTVEATLLLIAATIVMLGRVPIGAKIPWVTQITAWILDVPNTAAKRGIMIGVGLGMVSTSIKIMLGIERTYLGGKD